jgi:CIC family chloride channel protein
MKDNLTQADHLEDCPGSLLVLSLLSLAVGVISGVVCAIFRVLLERADRLRDLLIAWAHGQGIAGLLFVLCVCGSAVVLSAWLVRRLAPQASGSGIPHVEAVLRGELPQAPFRLIPVKFLGGLLAIGSGLALGREGPSVQMGASLSHLVGRIFGRTWPDCRVLIAAGAGAGLATAFNAPIAGAIFVLEELVRQFETRIAIAALGASATAIAVARVFLGDTPDFYVHALSYPQAGVRPLYYALGAVAGLWAIAFNRTLLATLAAADRLTKMPAEVRAGLVGLAVGGLAWVAPDLVGGGDGITQRALAGGIVLAAIPAAFMVRFVLGTVSYAIGTPGGLFAPLLVLGAQLGLLFGGTCRWLLPNQGIEPEGFAIVGMAAFFTGVVRAPVTGIVLVTEMTASVSMLLPMICASFVAMLAPTLFGDPPIYDALRSRASGAPSPATSP